MKQKELKNLAKKVAKLETDYQATDSSDEKRKIEQELMKISASVHDFEDLAVLDELVQDLLKDNS